MKEPQIEPYNRYFIVFFFYLRIGMKISSGSDIIGHGNQVVKTEYGQYFSASAFVESEKDRIAAIISINEVTETEAKNFISGSDEEIRTQKPVA